MAGLYFHIPFLPQGLHLLRLPFQHVAEDRVMLLN